MIIRDTPTGAEAVHVGVELSTESHGRSPNRALDGAALLDRENATAMYMTLRSVISGLQENYLIRISFDREDDITITLVAVWARVRDALETLIARIARIIMLSRKESYIIETFLRRKRKLTFERTKPPIISLFVCRSS